MINLKFYAKGDELALRWGWDASTEKEDGGGDGGKGEGRARNLGELTCPNHQAFLRSTSSPLLHHVGRSR